jgi:hypothetical protein
MVFCKTVCLCSVRAFRSLARLDHTQRADGLKNDAENLRAAREPLAEAVSRRTDYEPVRLVKHAGATKKEGSAVREEE